MLQAKAFFIIALLLAVLNGNTKHNFIKDFQISQLVGQPRVNLRSINGEGCLLVEKVLFRRKLLIPNH